MSERRNFPADSKNRTTEGKAVGRDSVDSFAYIFDYISLKIDDNLRVIKVRVAFFLKILFCNQSSQLRFMVTCNCI